MGLNIKSEDVHKLAKALADETGTSMTAAIRQALEEKLDRVRRERDSDARIEWVENYLKKLGPPPPGLTSDHSDLYDEDGLPA